MMNFEDFEENSKMQSICWSWSMKFLEFSTFVTPFYKNIAVSVGDALSSKDGGYRTLEIEGDSKLVINAINVICLGIWVFSNL